ncbi:MAG: hypothetical protein ACJ8F1_22135 [Polyangia bacterium]
MRILGAAGLSVGLLLCIANPVGAQEVPVPEIGVRAFAGLGSGVGAQLWSAQRVRVDVSVGTLAVTSFDWMSAAVVVRVVGGPRRFIGVRGGFQVEYDGDDRGTWTGSRTADALDAGLVARIESARGSAVEGQAGVEGVFRSSPAVCCDDAALPTRSAGVRLSLTGELAVSGELALFAQGELRTGAHVMEIRWLPTAAAGVRYRF